MIHHVIVSVLPCPFYPRFSTILTIAQKKKIAAAEFAFVRHYLKVQIHGKKELLLQELFLIHVNYTDPRRCKEQEEKRITQNNAEVVTMMDRRGNNIPPGRGRVGPDTFWKRQVGGTAAQKLQIHEPYSVKCSTRESVVTWACPTGCAAVSMNTGALASFRPC